MIYITNFDSTIKFNKSLFVDLLDNLKSIDNANTNYHIKISHDGYCVVGVIVQENSNCIIDLKNHNINAKDFFLWLKEVLSNYEDFYCVPNQKGEMIWKAFGLNNSPLYLNLNLLNIFKKKIKFRFIKFLYINMFFDLSTRKGIFKIRRKIFFNKRVPKQINLDTF